MEVISFDEGPEEELPAAPRRPAWWRVASLLVALGVAFAAGVGVGHRASGGPPATASPAPAAVGGSGSRCWEQVGDALWLGAELVNRGPGPVTVLGADVGLPLGGFEVRSGTWGPCGQLHPAPWAGTYQEVGENATLWVSATLALTFPDRCPGPLPVFFGVHYRDATGRVRDLQLGFVDLGDVPYSACQTSS